jgi:membrane carboxypeptidase/penicillin-binding protein PbpC
MALPASSSKVVRLPGNVTAAPLLAQLDEHVAQMGRALQAGDAQTLQVAATELLAALEAAASSLREPGALPPALRRHLADTAARVLAQREALARAGASIERGLDLLLPGARPGAATYSAAGYAERTAATGSAWA